MPPPEARPSPTVKPLREKTEGRGRCTDCRPSTPNMASHSHPREVWCRECPAETVGRGSTGEVQSLHKAKEHMCRLKTRATVTSDSSIQEPTSHKWKSDTWPQCVENWPAIEWVAEKQAPHRSTGVLCTCRKRLPGLLSALCILR